MNLAIIPARGGSKRIKNKNIKIFHGKPIIYYSISAAKRSGIFDEIIVSTDSSKIASISRKYGARVPFLRPAKFSNDKVGVGQVMVHTLKKLNIKPDLKTKICCIYATAPMLKISFLKEGCKKLRKKYNYALAVKQIDSRALRGFVSCGDNVIKPIQKKNTNTKSQNLKNAYIDSAQFCWGFAKSWLNNKNCYNSKSTFVTIPEKYVQDIDTAIDWKRAHAKFKMLKK